MGGRDQEWSIGRVGVASAVYVGSQKTTEAFVVRVRPGGASLEYSTFVGGTADDRGSAVVVDGRVALSRLGSPSRTISRRFHRFRIAPVPLTLSSRCWTE